MPTSFEETVPTIWCIVIWLLCLIITYFTQRFYRMRHRQALQKRCPKLVYLATVSCILYLVGFQFFSALGTIYEDTQSGAMFNLLSSIFYAFSIHGVAIAFIGRSWIIYFNIQWRIQTEKQAWVIHIDNSSSSSFWFIKHRKDYGSNRFIFIVMFSYYIIEASVISALLIMALPWAILDMLCHSIEIIILVILWNKIPAFYDVFGIKEELKYILCVAAALLLIFICGNVGYAFSGYTFVGWYLFMFIYSVCLTVIALLFNGYIFRSKFTKLLARSYEIKDLMLQNVHNAHQQNIQGVDENNQNTIQLKETLNSKELIEAFFIHLADEFSVELLLSFVEFTQFKSCLMNDHGFMDKIQDIVHGDALRNVSIYNRLPQSHIVYESHKHVPHVGRYLWITKALFDKYVNYGAEFEINISYKDKQQIISFVNTYCDERNFGENASIDLGKEQLYELFMLYEHAQETVYSLMSFAHQRFVKTTRFMSIS
eukprot:189484_1